MSNDTPPTPTPDPALRRLSAAELSRRLADAIARRDYDAMPALRTEQARRAMKGQGKPYLHMRPRRKGRE